MRSFCQLQLPFDPQRYAGRGWDECSIIAPDHAKLLIVRLQDWDKLWATFLVSRDDLREFETSPELAKSRFFILCGGEAELPYEVEYRLVAYLDVESAYRPKGLLVLEH